MCSKGFGEVLSGVVGIYRVSVRVLWGFVEVFKGFCSFSVCVPLCSSLSRRLLV